MSYEIKTLRRTLECQPEVPGTISRQLLKIFTAQETRERKEKSMELSLDSLTKQYGRKIAVECVSATLKPGV